MTQVTPGELAFPGVGLARVPRSFGPPLNNAEPIHRTWRATQIVGTGRVDAAVTSAAGTSNGRAS